MATVSVRQTIHRDQQSIKPVLPATIVLLHGWGFDSQIWQPLVSRLNQWADICLLDIDFKNQSVASVCERIVEAMPKHSLLIGWSLGGMLATHIVAKALAERKNKTVVGLVTLSANLKFVASQSWPVAMAPETFSAFVEGTHNNSVKQLKRFNLLVTKGDKNSREQLQWLQNFMSLNTPDAKSLSDGLSILDAIDNTQSLKEIHIPSLFLFGDNDQLVPSLVADQLPKVNTQKIHTLSQKGHCLHYPVGECHMRIEQFLEQLCGD